MTLEPAPVVRTSRLRKWLWKGGVGLALFIVTMAIGNGFVHPEKRVTTRSVGHDFIAFYTAGTFLNEGRLAEVYELDKLKVFQRDVIAREGLGIEGGSFGPFWNPPVFAWVFAPLARLEYFTAWWVWFWINSVCLCGAIGLLVLMMREGMGGTPMLREKGWTVWGLVPLLVVISLPAIQSLGHGQNTSISLLILTIIVWLWRRDQRVLAGMACGLLFYKPQLALVVAGIVCITLGWRAMVGLAFTGVILLGMSELTMPGVTRVWAEKLPGIVNYMQVERRYMWDRHVTLKAFWRLLIQGYELGNTRPVAALAWVISIGALSFGLTIAVVRMLTRGTGEGSQRDWLIAATLVSMPLLMPFYFDYDLLLLAVAAVVFAIQWMKAESHARLDWMMLASWIVLYAWMFANPFVGRWTGVNGTVLLLCAVSGMLIIRAARACETKGAAVELEVQTPPTPTPTKNAPALAI